MKALILILAAVTASAADAPRITFSKSFPGSAPPFFSITVERAGAASYNESTDPDNAETLTLEKQAVTEMFWLADKLDHFKKPLESGLRVANMGQKTLRWEDGAEKSESKYNYSVIEDARTLGDWFEKIADSTRLLVELKRAMRHDKLGVNAAIVNVQILWNNRRLVGTAQNLPVLDQIAANEAFMHMSREREAEIADAIRAMPGK